MCSRSVTAEFTAGPNRHPFYMSFDNEDIDGKETITVTGPCFAIEAEDECPPHDFTVEFEDNEIEQFLVAAGLEDAQPERAASGIMSPQQRRRWLLGDVIHDAVGLVEDKYVTPFARCLFVTPCAGTGPKTTAALHWEWDRSASTVGWG